MSVPSVAFPYPIKYHFHSTRDKIIQWLLLSNRLKCLRLTYFFLYYWWSYIHTFGEDFELLYYSMSHLASYDDTAGQKFHHENNIYIWKGVAISKWWFIFALLLFFPLAQALHPLSLWAHLNNYYNPEECKLRGTHNGGKGKTLPGK